MVWAISSDAGIMTEPIGFVKRIRISSAPGRTFLLLLMGHHGLWDKTTLEISLRFFWGAYESRIILGYRGTMPA